ncbi:MAG: hypothetical protein GY878_02515 [Fuerstiella sp.]|nr:hypothetical protein [Fuerstiella sp.]
MPRHTANSRLAALRRTFLSQSDRGGRASKGRRTATAVALMVMASASLALACSVPVFRYALEHWRPDSYIAFVFNSGDLTAEQQAAVDSMQPLAADGAPLTNVTVTVIDVDTDTDPVTQKLWQDHQSEQLPRMVVQSPPKWGPPQTIWQGEFTAKNAAMVMDSPARAHVGKKLVEGESVVWIFLECGQPEVDDSAFSVLTSELKRLQSELKLPEIEEEDLGDLSVNPDALKIAFSAVRISREDAVERALVEMLLRVEPDLMDDELSGQPMAFPVFGRGRALYALVGKGIAPEVIEDASQFLTGACQCTVKAQNPGVDLIMNVDWDGMVIPTEPLDEDLPPLAGFSGFGLPDDNAENTGADETSASVKEPEVLLAQTTSKTNAAHNDSSESHDVVAATETAEAGDASQTAASHVAASDAVAAPSAGMGQNVMFVLMFLVVGVVVASLFFMPRSS